MKAKINIPILYEDKNLLVINKPAGISVHRDGKNDEYTIAEWVIENYPKIKNVGDKFIIERAGGKKEEIPRPGIVHRLDKETSGALIIAKNQKTFSFIKEQFQNHQVQKVYRAFVYNYVKDPKASLLNKQRGIINAPIGRSPNDIRMWTAGRGAHSGVQDAVTEYIVLNKFTDTDDEKLKKDSTHQFSFLEVYPQTGRTHQIRVHLRYINHPVVSDPIYSGNKEKALGFKRLALHAYSVTFTLPNGPARPHESGAGGEKKTVMAPMPKDFESVIKKYLNLA